MFNRILPLVIPLLTLILFEVFFFNPPMIYVVVVLIILFIFFAIWQFSRDSDAGKDWWNFLILPSLLTISVIAYSTLLSSRLVIQLLFFLNIVLLYLYLRYIYYYLVRPSHYQAFSIENISSYGNFLTFFLAVTTIYGLQSFLSIQTWPLIVIILIVSGLIIYQVMWANKIDLRSGLIYILVSCLVIVELAWAISFLPVNHNIAGLTLAICYYILIGLVKHFLLDRLDKKTVRLYLGFGLTSLFIILITARWL